MEPALPVRPRNLKWYSSIAEIFEHEIVREERERFYWDLYLLKPDKEHLRERLDKLSIQELLGTHKQNLNDLIGYAIRSLKNAAENVQASIDSVEGTIESEQNEVDQIRLSNALETLSAIFKTILAKERGENFNVDLISLFAGSIDNSDPVFSDFVYSIDKILSDQTQSLRTRHRTLQLALSVVSGVNQGSINAYFLRRDLFNTIASLIANPQTVSLVFDSVLFLDLLANFRRFESRNPYLVRMEDYVDEKAMESILNLSILALDDLKEAYQDISDSKNANSSLIGQVMNVIGSPLTKRTNPIPTNNKGEAFKILPGLPISILLPIYDLLNSNTTFLNVLILSQSFWESFLSFSSFILSNSSSLTTSTSNSNSNSDSDSRSEIYAKLVLVICIYLLEEAHKFICGISPDSFSVHVDFCRDRQPTLGPLSDLNRLPIAGILDNGILYLRHNLTKNFKIQSHLICLKLIHQSLFCLKSNLVRLDNFDWRELWRALLSLASRIGSRIDQIKNLPNIDRLAQQILDILSFAAIWSDVLFKDDLTISILYFEILRSEETIKNLILVANLSSSKNESGSMGRKSALTTSTNSNNGGNGNGSSNLGVSTIESVKNLNTIISKSKWIIETSRHPKKSGNNSSMTSSIVPFNFLFSSSPSSNDQPPEHNNGVEAIVPAPMSSSSNLGGGRVSSADECLAAIQANLNQIGLIDSASLDDHLRKYSELDKIEDLKKFIGFVPDDVFHLMVM
ncbi:hypothetical protein PSTG_11371 [Puccinia striiformis f. sp. tritici PST-78]|uniref:Armadillo-like helical domain-containing protein n=1 Tax=Puccinia striiformis f. sp. tritici PST-78 TaxID=1165861 RepID=A0A0L0V7W9_9BASI|nr:hypothetical protein PSTG_11371 [Puccinia striiformis f. sp. tritici PST-78]